MEHDPYGRAIDPPEVIACCLSCPLKECICNARGECPRIDREVRQHDRNQSCDSDMDLCDAVFDSRAYTGE